MVIGPPDPHDPSRFVDPFDPWPTNTSSALTWPICLGVNSGHIFEISHLNFAKCIVLTMKISRVICKFRSRSSTACTAVQAVVRYKPMSNAMGKAKLRLPTSAKPLDWFWSNFKLRTAPLDYPHARNMWLRSDDIDCLGGYTVCRFKFVFVAALRSRC